MFKSSASSKGNCAALRTCPARERFGPSVTESRPASKRASRPCFTRLERYSVRRKRPKVVRKQALRVEQDRKHPLYLFTLTAEELLQIADVSRLSRGKAGELVGYQRAEVKRHIRNIVEYLDSGDVLFPNSLILSLPSTTRFSRQRASRHSDKHAEAGTIEIVLPRKGRPKTAWIVDGQQRAVALSRSRHTGLAVPVNAFVADDVDIQREQFLRINSTKPLPRGLITELLPEIAT